jgi:hypothetical protein
VHLQRGQHRGADNATLDADVDRRLKDVLEVGPNIHPAQFFSASPFASTSTETLRGALSTTVIHLNGDIVVQDARDPKATADAVLEALRTRAGG